MELKSWITKGSEWLDEVVQKLSDKEFQEMVLEKSAQALKTASDVVADATVKTADVTVKTLKKTKEYAEENRLMPGAKDKYIAELEAELEKKDRQIRLLKKKLWSKNKKNRKGFRS